MLGSRHPSPLARPLLQARAPRWQSSRNDDGERFSDIARSINLITYLLIYLFTYLLLANSGSATGREVVHTLTVMTIMMTTTTTMKND